MDTLKQIKAMIDCQIENDGYKALFLCYVLRRVLNWTPRQAGEYLGHSPVAVNSYAIKAAILFDLPNDNTSKYGILLESCQKCVTRNKTKCHLHHVKDVANRMTERLKREA